MYQAHIVVRGRVQRVGYRNWIFIQAKNLKVRGWVKNMPDGSVEIMAEGSRENLNSLVTLARRGPPLARVDSEETAWSTKSVVEFDDFLVLR